MRPPLRGLYLAEDGHWFHDGDAVEHVRLEALLHRCITLGPHGDLRVQNGRESLPFAAQDLPLRVLRLEGVGDTLALTLSNEQVEPLLPHTLAVDPDGRLRCMTRAGLAARFTRSAQWALHPWLQEQDGRVVLCLGCGTFPLL